jgi:hypothetical protein
MPDFIKPSSGERRKRFRHDGYIGVITVLLPNGHSMATAVTEDG